MNAAASLPREGRVFVLDCDDGYRVNVLCMSILGPLIMAYSLQVGPVYRTLDDAEASAAVLNILATEAMIPADLTEQDAVRLAHFAQPLED